MSEKAIATFAGGCFWGIEDLYRKLDGVYDAVSGYIGGQTENPGYREVCSGMTGHAEAVQVSYDPSKITYQELLHYFWEIHDPTTLNRQGPDHGTQYRSAIFANSAEQFEEAKASKEHFQQYFNKLIVTEIQMASEFYPAEDYHQHYFENNGGHGCHIRRPIAREATRS